MRAMTDPDTTNRSRSLPMNGVGMMGLVLALIGLLAFGAFALMFLTGLIGEAMR